VHLCYSANLTAQATERTALLRLMKLPVRLAQEFITAVRHGWIATPKLQTAKYTELISLHRETSCRRRAKWGVSKALNCACRRASRRTTCTPIAQRDVYIIQPFSWKGASEGRWTARGSFLEAWSALPWRKEENRDIICTFCKVQWPVASDFLH
jgi:hypothetical protein